jgi:alanine-glyoxylate transaminase/serine-glyoxylate transaminase/serine-pyruvate transaminase
MLCLSALGSVLMDMGHPIKVGEAEAAAHQAYATLHAADALHARKKVATLA